MSRTDETAGTPTATGQAPLGAASLLAILDSLPHLVSLWDRDRRCVFANTAAAAAFGLTPARMQGMSQVEVMGRPAVALVERNIVAALADETTSMDRVLFDGEGGLRYYQVGYSPNRVAGETVGYSSTWVDVTPQLHLLAEVSRDSTRLARMAERQRLTALAGDEVLHQLDDLSGLLTRTRPEGGAAADLEAAADAIADAIAHLREAAELARALRLPPARPDEEILVVGFDHERELAQPPAREAWFAPVASGRLDDGVPAVAALLDEVPVVITEWSPERVLRYANKAATAFLKRGAGDVLGRRMEEIVGEPFVAAIEPYAEAALAGEAQSYYRREADPQGGWLHFHVRYVPRLEDGVVVGVYAYATDISLRIEAAQALSAARTEHAALQERQTIHDQLHAAVLQQLFAAKLAVEMASRASGDSQDEHLAVAHTSVGQATDSLRAILGTGSGQDG